MEAIPHFCHEHKLIFNPNLSVIEVDEEEEIICNGCQKKISGESAVYTCEEEDCEFFLHERCSQIPKEINHHMHQEHPYGPAAPLVFREEGHIICNTCRGNWVGFVFTCHSCDFDVCLRCVLLNEDSAIIEHKSHPSHKLKLISRLASFFCDACSVEDKDMSYRCTSCEYWIHKTCAFTGDKIECSGHHHPLFLKYSLPFVNRKFDFSCDICKETVHQSRWVYLCPGCRFFSHVKCALALEQRLGDDPSKIASEIEIDPNIIRLPPVDESVNPLIQLISKLMVSLVEDNEMIQTKLDHWSHDHPLLLYGDNIVSSDEDQSNHTRNSNEHKLCNGCLLPIISFPFYGCQEQDCNFFLHIFCSKLPSHVQIPPFEPGHEYVLAAPSICDGFQCNCCLEYCNGFLYRNMEREIMFCIQCASTVTTIKHESHHHPLVSDTESSWYENNKCCDAWGNYDTSYICKSCSDFRICSKCTMFPRTINHDWDKHPIYLSYPPFYWHPEEFYCEICEEEINPKLWLYTCRDCDHSFHTNCLTPDLNYQKFKYGRKMIFEGTHLHALTHIQPETGTCCNQCGDSDEVVFECAPCNFYLCSDCADSCMTNTDENFRVAPNNLPSSSLGIKELYEEM